ncbi:MAG TPA: HRDC domain-containing protein [Gemmatimonadaceae bacterium]|nr:HRDC domain-containing protein [Gemmatimonadaceae bacterium]
MSPRSPHEPLYLDRPEAVADFMATLGRPALIAVDTEGASFHRFVDRIYLLQLSTRERTAVIDPLPIGTPEPLGRLLEDRAVEKVFHDADYDLRLLQQDYGWQVRNIFDTRIAAQLLGIRAFGLAALLERYFGLTLDKKYQRADWSQRPLTRGMLDYAAEDTMHLPELRDRMGADLQRKGRWAWAAEEFARLEGTRWEPEDGTTAFLRLKGARDLNRRELAVLRELVRWRDDVARAADKATFRIVSNDVLLEAARVKPPEVGRLGGIKGMPRGLYEARRAEIEAAIDRGHAVADAELPRFPKALRWDKDPDFDARVAALRAARDDAAERLDLDPGVLCSRDRIEAIARKRPQRVAELTESGELRRWQAAELGEAFVEALAEGSPYKES